MKTLMVKGTGLLNPAMPWDVGYDLLCQEDVWLNPDEAPYPVPADANVKIPDDCWGLILPRSCAALQRIGIVPGVIDSGYVGPLYTMAYVLMGAGLKIKKGSRLAQLIILPRTVLPIKAVQTLPQTPRGEQGFGSTNA